MTSAAIASSPDRRIVRQHNHCRVCRTRLPAPYLDLGEQPLANALRDPQDTTPEFRAPLAVTRCPACGLSQLTVVVDPDVLYSGYRFRSGLSEKWREHCEDLTSRLEGRTGTVLDIACNDGALLDAFREQGWRCVGVDPAPASDKHEIEEGYWNESLAVRVRARHGLFNLVVAQNVLGHVDDPVEFLRAAASVLAEDGGVVVEVPDTEHMVAKGEFDTIYHEHLSYWTQEAMYHAAARAGLEVSHKEWFPHIHGGTYRYWLHPAVHVEGLAASMARTITDLARYLSGYPNHRIWAYGASAKGAVMLNALANMYLCPMPLVAIDDTEEKQGLLMPGVGIPVVSMPDSLEDVDILWLLSWNNAETLKTKARERGFKGRFLLTVPNVRLED